MNFRTLDPEKKLEFAELMLQPLTSPERLRNWIMLFLGLDMPMGHIDPDSNSSPVEAMWEIYDNIRQNKGEENPGYIMLSARAGYKTLSASILEVLLMIHFQMTIAHMAAIKDQSAKSVKYINYFFSKIEDLLVIKGWENKSQNKMMIEWRSPEGEDVYIQIVVATMSGANSAHTNLMFIDEVDVVKDPAAYEEAKLIPEYAKGVNPVTVKLSTRKFAFGLMQQEIDKAQDPNDPSGDKILRWNILDVTERCPETRHKPEEPTEDRYVGKVLPLRQISVEEFGQLSPPEQEKFDKVENAFAGCKTCKLLPVCRTRLAKRSENDVKGLYKPVGVVLNAFKKTNPDRAEAQLLCWKPSSKGMVYPRFENVINKGNVVTKEFAWETLMGDPPVKSEVTDIDLIFQMQTLGIRFFAGVDWGHTHDFVIVIFAMIPNGEVWIMDCYSQAGLEFSECLTAAITYRDKYKVERWFCDTAQPSHMKSFNRNHMKSPNFVKDVMGGIEALRSKIVDSFGRRWLKIINIAANQKVILAFLKHHFKLDNLGNPTIEPDDTPGVADQADAMRYVAQNMFPIKGPQKPMVEEVNSQGQKVDPNSPEAREKARIASQHEQQMKDEVSKLLGGSQPTIGTGRKGGFFYSS